MKIAKFEWAKTLNSQDIINFETVQNIKLPEHYKKFLLQNNGGKVESKPFTFYNENLYLPKGQEAIMRYFYCINENVEEGTQKNYTLSNNIRFREARLPKETISIGTDEGGNEILLFVQEGNNYGKIYFWDHEYEREKPTFENTTILANSFSDFLELL